MLKISIPEYMSFSRSNKALYGKGSTKVENGVVKISVPARDGVVLAEG